MEFSGHKAIYLQIADQVCESILTGKWEFENKIPSVRDMAVQIEVNPNTVARAYSHLQERGIIINKRGLGYFITKEAMEITLKEKQEAFITIELPRIFKMMHILKINPESLEELYESYQLQNGGENENK